MAKKYYWLKLNQNFFEREEIKVIESMDNGKDYIIFYMKLLLKSIKTEGELRFRDVIPYTPEMLSSITGTNIDTVRVATDMFVKLGLMEKWDDGTLFMVETKNMIGSETDAARRKRKQRAQQKQLEDKSKKDKKDSKCDNVTDQSQKGHTEIEKEKEIEKDIDKEKELEEKDSSSNSNRQIDEINSSQEEISSTGEGKEVKTEFSKISHLYQKCGFPVNGLTADWIKGILEDFGFEWCENALLEAESRGKRNKKYVEAILNNWKTDGGMKLKRDKSKENGAKNKSNKSSPSIKTRFHNFEQRTSKYTAEELERMVRGK